MPEVWTPPAFDDIATSETVTAAYLNQLGNSLRFLKRVGETVFSADVSITATTAGTANQIASLGAITYENVPHLLEFHFVRYSAPVAISTFLLRDGTTILGTVTRNAASENIALPYFAYPITPTAASHTYNIAGFVASGTGTVEAGTGGTAGDATTYLQGFIRITRVPT